MQDDEMINFFIGCCISADNNITDEDRKQNINILQKLIQEKNLNLTKDQIKIAKQGIELLQKELEVK